MKDIKPKIIRWKTLVQMIPISRSTVDRWEKKGTFPKRIILGENSVGWYLDDIEKWIGQKVFYEK